MSLDLASLPQQLRVPVIAAPLFIISQPELVIAQCKAGIVGSFPALNARGEGELNRWITRIKEETKGAAPYAVNLIVHQSNTQLQSDLATCIAHKAPLIITSLGLVPEIIEAVHAYGGKIMHDVISLRHAQKAIAAGVDGLILVTAGAGGHAGTLNPFAFSAEIRAIYAGPLALAGSITHGAQVKAAQLLGADFAYIGTPFIATHEANASDAYRQSIVDSSAADIVYTPYFTGVAGNYLKSSIVNAGLDPTQLSEAKGDLGQLQKAAGATTKAWRDIWGAGQGVGSITAVETTAQRVDTLVQQYRAASVTA